jgi:L-malate glycosyltransferase
MIIPSLATGGAEWAFVRQANALAPVHAVTAYVPWACDSSATLLKAFDARVRLVSLPLPWAWMHRLIYKLTLLFPRLNLEQQLHRVVLGLLHRLEHFQVVNAHLHSGVRLACDAFRQQQVPVIETDHGDYALLKKENPTLERHHEVFKRLDAIVCPSQANLNTVKEMPWKTGFRQTVIPYAAQPITLSHKDALLEGDPTAFTFGLVSRGIAEKGWAEALAAFRLLQKQITRPIRLIFVGEGAEIQRLREEVHSDEFVVFAGHQADPSGWISRFDVGLLPSYFTAESLPNVVIECQMQGKPVIATQIGGIPEMLEFRGKPSGILIPISPKTGRADVPSLASAMQRLLQDRSLQADCSAAALEAYARYSPRACANAYGDFFASMTSHV